MVYGPVNDHEKVWLGHPVFVEYVFGMQEDSSVNVTAELTHGAVLLAEKSTVEADGGTNLLFPLVNKNDALVPVRAAAARVCWSAVNRSVVLQ